ncbi:hypothetical protein [uncultured Flavobacterium sp.]|uniref:hypothetical protein n=1 Tax=uncultured Flavobacterium sp. TaxID=165435 RepID=UPI0030EE68D8|tara:strand:- start:53145 stop:53960 length:816 start_codon:yes stop_codon:yes gene_type:complete
MRIFKYIFDFYIQSSLHVALAVYALICITFFKLNISYDEPVAYFGFFGTIVGYNFIKYDELARIKKIKLTKTFKAIIFLSILSALATFYYYLELKTKTKLIGFGALLLTILYTLPFFPHRTNMRNWSGLKIYLVAIAWVGVTVLLPVINADMDFSIIVILKCIQRFFFVFILMLIFEIIDLQFDEKFLETIPQKLGEKQTKNLIYLLVLVFLALEYFKPNITLNQFAVTFLVAIILGLLTYFASSKRNKYFTSFWVESMPFFWLILLLVFS